MSDFNLDNHKYVDLGYPHQTIIDLLEKIEKGFVLTENQHKTLIKDIGLENISTFDGNYHSLKNLPDISREVQQIIDSLNLASNITVGNALEALKNEIDKNIDALGKQKADAVHIHQANEIVGIEDMLDDKADWNHTHGDEYYNKEQIDGMLNDMVGGGVDLTGYVTLKELANHLLAYATIEQLSQYALKEHTHEGMDFSSLKTEFDKKANVDDVYNKEQIDEMLQNVSGIVPDNLLTKEEANQTFSKIEDIEALMELIDLLEKAIEDSEKDTTDSISRVQTNLENKIDQEKQYLEAQLNNTKSELSDMISEKADDNHTHNMYYTKSEIDNKLVELGTGGSIDLDGYLKQEDLLEIQESVNDLKKDLNKKSDIGHVHVDYVTKNELEDKNYATMAYVDSIVSNLDGSVDIPDDIMEIINNKADADHSHSDYAEVNHSHNNYAEINHTHQFMLDSINSIQNNLANKADKSEVLTEEDIIDIVKNNAGSSIDPEHTHDEYALKEHTHDEYAEAEHEHENYAQKNHGHEIENITNLQATLDKKAEANMVYTKEQIDKKLVDISTGGTIELEGFIKQSDLMEGLATKSDLGHGHSITEIEGLQEILDDKSDLANLATKEEITQGLATKADVNHHHDDKYSALEHTHEEHYTKDQTAEVVNDLLEVKAAEIIAEATAYADEAVIRLTEGAPENLNNFAEVSTAIQEQDNKLTNNINSLNSSLASKADISHTHSEYATVEDEAAREIFTTTELTVSTLGGIQAGSNLNGLTVKEILNKLLYPYVAPTISIQGTPNGGIFEKGNVQAITNARVIVTKKSEKIIKIEVLQGSTVLGVKEDTSIADGGTFNFPVNVKVNSTNVQLTGKVTDASGTVKTSTTAAFNFVYPYYVGVCGENDTVDETLIKGLTKRIEAKGTKSISYTTTNQKMIIAYPKAYGVIKKILDPNSFDVTSTFTITEIKITGLDGTSQSYYVYVNNASTVSGFTMTFSY